MIVDGFWKFLINILIVTGGLSIVLEGVLSEMVPFGGVRPQV